MHTFLEIPSLAPDIRLRLMSVGSLGIIKGYEEKKS